MIPRRIYFSGGGICAVAHVGALQELAKHMPLTAIKEWMGVSAGALTAMCLAIGFTIEELADFTTRFDFTQIQQPDSPTGWILHMGLDTGERLQRLVNACLRVKGFPADVTFHALQQRTGASLRVLATDLNLAKGVCFSPDDTPDYPVAIAVCASMTFPFYFQPILCPQTGHSLIDGAVTSNYPMYLLSKEECRRTLCFLLYIEPPKTDTLDDLPPEHLLIRPLSITLMEKTNIEATFYEAECIRIPIGFINIMDFSLSKEIKKELVEKGREAVRAWLRTRSPPPRRNSI